MAKKVIRRPATTTAQILGQFGSTLTIAEREEISRREANMRAAKVLAHGCDFSSAMSGYLEPHHRAFSH